jgi:hypothetical protein
MIKKTINVSANLTPIKLEDREAIKEIIKFCINSYYQTVVEFGSVRIEYSNSKIDKCDIYRIKATTNKTFIDVLKSLVYVPVVGMFAVFSPSELDVELMCDSIVDAVVEYPELAKVNPESFFVVLNGLRASQLEIKNDTGTR